jgi:hypothetical protein
MARLIRRQINIALFRLFVRHSNTSIANSKFVKTAIYYISVGTLQRATSGRLPTPLLGRQLTEVGRVASVVAPLVAAERSRSTADLDECWLSEC